MYRYRQTFQVRAYETDPNGELTLPFLVNYFQEVAWNSSAENGASTHKLHDMGLAWVLYRMQIEIDRLPRYAEEIEVQTWPSGRERVYVFRDFRIMAGGEEIARAKSTWLVFNLERRRLSPVPDFIIQVLDNIETPPGYVPTELPVAENDDFTWQTPAQPTRMDEDLNGHVNHGLYFRWLLESLPPETAAQRKLHRVDLTFRKEVLPGDLLSLQAKAGEENAFFHRFLRTNDQEPVATGTTFWLAPNHF